MCKSTQIGKDLQRAIVFVFLLWLIAFYGHLVIYSVALKENYWLLYPIKASYVPFLKKTKMIKIKIRTKPDEF